MCRPNAGSIPELHMARLQVNERLKKTKWYTVKQRAVMRIKKEHLTDQIKQLELVKKLLQASASKKVLSLLSQFSSISWCYRSIALF